MFISWCLFLNMYFTHFLMFLPFNLLCLNITCFSHGSKIEASIRKPLMPKFGSLIVEGEVYLMASFLVVENFGSCRATRHEFKLMFSWRTKIVHVESDKIPSFGCTLVDSDFIAKIKRVSDYLIGKLKIYLCPIFISYTRLLFLSK